MLKNLLLGIAALLITGCGSLPQAHQQGTSATYLGDYKSYYFNDLIVSVKQADGKILNLHVTFSAVVNPKEKYILSSTYAELRNLVYRLETRMKAQLVTETLSFDSKTISNTPQLRETLQQSAQAIFDTEYRKWKKSSYFEVQLVITSLYFTDLSVGNTTVNRWRW